jgi:hypothetical protein
MRDSPLSLYLEIALLINKGFLMSVTQLVPKDDVHRQFEARLQSGDLNLPPLPRAAAQVIELTSNEDANSQQLAKLI